MSMHGSVSEVIQKSWSVIKMLGRICLIIPAHVTPHPPGGLMHKKQKHVREPRAGTFSC